ncbi:MAG: hypothetical protein ACI94Y_002172 [Maribacter sp.]|jgi:hypothetical protein
MIGSTADNKTDLIEKSTEKTALYYSELQDHIICALIIINLMNSIIMN